MDKQLPVETASDPFDALKTVKDSVSAFNQIVLKASEDLQKIRSASGTSTALDSMVSVTPFLSSMGPQQLAWQIPTLYESQSERILKALLDSVGVLSRSQQAIFELMAQSLSRAVQQTVKAMTQVNETVASRRVSAAIIDFADRREKAQAVLARADDASNKQEISYPIARKISG